MNVLRMNKPELISELEKRSLPTTGLKEELKSRLMEAVEKETCDEGNGDNSTVDVGDNEENNLKSDLDEKDEEKDCSVDVEVNKNANDETLNENETVIGADPSSNITVEDSIKMKTQHELENDSMKVIVIEDDEDDSISNSPNNGNVNPVQTINNYNRELDNGDHEVIEINEEVIIDDDDNQESVTNYNDISSDSNQLQSRDVEKIESRKEDVQKPPVKTEIWVSNIADDVKAVELKELFGKYGKVISAKVVTNARNPGNCYGCIQLASSDDAKLCIMNLDQTDFRGHIITISNEFTEKAPKEKAVRQPSPASSTESWGSKKNTEKEAPTSSPILSQQTNKVKIDSFEKEKRPLYREKPNTGGSYYKPRDFQENRGGGSFNRRGGGGNRSNYDDRRRNFNDRQQPARSYYSKPNSGGYSGGGGVNTYNNHEGNRGRDIMPRRENYNPSYESRYSASSMPARERPIARNDYQEKFKPNYEYRGRMDKYDAYDDYDRHDRRSGPGGVAYDRGGRGDMGGYPPKRPDMYNKRSRPDDEDDYMHSKKRRPDPIATDRPHYYRAVESPKKSVPYYHPGESPISTGLSGRLAHRLAVPRDTARCITDKEFRKSEYKPAPRREDYIPDYSSHSKTERDFFPMRRAPIAEYSSARREPYEVYSPPDRHMPRSNHYSKEPYGQQHSADFGGRSRRY